MKKNTVFNIYKPIVGSDNKVRQVVVVGLLKREVDNEVIGWETTLVPESEIIVQNQYSINLIKKTLYIGYAITHPEDEFDLATGIKLARRMAESRPLTYAVTKSSNFFTKDIVLSILGNKIPEITKKLNETLSKQL